MKKRTLSVIALLFFGLTAMQAQRQETLFGESGFHFSGIWGSFTNNYTFFENDQAYQPGGTIGLEFGRAVFLGYAWSKQTDIINLGAGKTDFRLQQRNFIISIAPMSYQVLHPVISFQTGSGRLSLADGSSERVYVLQPSGGVELNIFKWFHLGAEAGYRFVTDTDLPGIERRDVSAFYGQLNLRFGISWGRYRHD